MLLDVLTGHSQEGDNDRKKLALTFDQFTHDPRKTVQLRLGSDNTFNTKPASIISGLPGDVTGTETAPRPTTPSAGATTWAAHDVVTPTL